MEYPQKIKEGKESMHVGCLHDLYPFFCHKRGVSMALVRPKPILCKSHSGIQFIKNNVDKSQLQTKFNLF